jgi:hypothetical protein
MLLPQVLEDVIKYRWKTLPAVQREGIRSYLVQKTIMVSMAYVYGAI